MDADVALLPTTPLEHLERYAPPVFPGWDGDDVFAASRSMSSLVGPIPVEGGLLLDYLKLVRRIVERPLDTGLPRMDDALARVVQILALPPRPTYGEGADFVLRPNATAENYTTKIFGSAHGVLVFVLDSRFGIDYRVLDAAERQMAVGAGCGSLDDNIGRTLEQQCASLGWPLTRFSVEKDGKAWVGRDGRRVRAEQAAMSLLVREDEVGSHCEGDCIKVLMKAASFDFLARRHRFDRVSAARAYLEGHCQILVDERDAIVRAIRNSHRATVESAIAFILAHAPTGASKVPLDAAIMLRVYDALGSDRLADIAAIFVERPYDYRAGWPDITIVGPRGVRFAEVKTTDRFHNSQVRFARDMAAPLGLECAVAQLLPLRG